MNMSELHSLMCHIRDQIRQATPANIKQAIHITMEVADDCTDGNTFISVADDAGNVILTSQMEFCDPDYFANMKGV